MNIEMGRDVLRSQPFSRLLGTEISLLEPGRATLELPMRPELTQQYGFAHGGVLSYLADNALTFAGGSMLGAVLTLEMKINYIRPAVGERLIARAEALSSGRNQAVCQCKVSAVAAGVEKLVAAAQGTVMKVDPPKD